MNKFEYPTCPPLQAKCIYGKIEFFIDNLFMPRLNIGERQTMLYVELKFESALQFHFFAPLILKRSKKKENASLTVIPNYGRESKENTIKYFNVKLIPFDPEDCLLEIMFQVFSRKGKFFQIGIK